MKIGQNSITLSYFLILIKTILYLLITSLSFANENKIGSVTELKGTIVAITEELDERDLLIHDPIFLNEEIFVSEGSSATIQFNDNTAIIMKELTSINVSEFENSKKNPKLKAELVKGKIIIESGSIAKKDNGEMIVGVTTSSLGLRGTRIDIDLKPSGKSNISLAIDSFGNVGEIKVNSDGKISNITSTEQVLEISENNETISRDKTDDEKEEEKSVSDTLIQSSKINEEEITKQLQKKLEDGNLQDANNDGIVNELDVDETKKQITEEKKQKIEFIVDNSKNENTKFLSNVIDQSDEKNTGEVIEKIIETKDNLVEGVVGNLADKDNKFLISSTSENAGLIKEKIFETIVTKETDKSAEILSKVMAKSDEATISSVINNITEKNTNEKSKLSLKVMADFSEKNPEKLETLNQNNSDQIEKLTISAVEKAASSEEDANLIAKVVAVASDELVNKVIEEVSKNATDEKEALSAKVMQSIVLTNPDKIDKLSDENKDIMIKQTINAAKNQNENKDDVNDDLADVIADIIVEADVDTAGQLLQELDQTELDDNSDLNLSIIIKLSEKDLFEEKLEVISIKNPLNESSIENLIVNSINEAKDNDNLEVITDLVIEDQGLIVETMIEASEKDEEDKQNVLEIITQVVEKDPEKAIEIIQENKNTEDSAEIIVTKIENGEAITIDDFEDVFDTNISPN